MTILVSSSSTITRPLKRLVSSGRRTSTRVIHGNFGVRAATASREPRCPTEDAALSAGNELVLCIAAGNKVDRDKCAASREEWAVGDAGRHERGARGGHHLGCEHGAAATASGGPAAINGKLR